MLDSAAPQSTDQPSRDEAGDLAPCEFAKRIKNAVRESDTVARLGGDEFVVILESLDGVANAIVVAEKVLEAMQQSLRVQDRTWNWSTSIGIAFRDGQSVDEKTYCAALTKRLMQPRLRVALVMRWRKAKLRALANH